MCKIGPALSEFIILLGAALVVLGKLILGIVFMLGVAGFITIMVILWAFGMPVNITKDDEVVGVLRWFKYTPNVE